MIKTEIFKNFDGRLLKKTYSDENYMILQVETGTVYDVAIDVENSNFEYEETNEKIEEVEK